MEFIPLLLLLFFISCLPVRADKGFIGHITDIHYDFHYLPGSATHCLLEQTGLGCCRKCSIPLNPSGNASIWGSFSCDSPLALINASFEFISSHFDLDLILWTGDNAGHHDFTQSLSQNIEATLTITNLFKHYFENIPVVPVIGNHDAYPVDQLGPDWLYENLYSKLLPAWQECSTVQTFTMDIIVSTCPTRLSRFWFSTISTLTQTISFTKWIRVCSKSN